MNNLYTLKTNLKKTKNMDEFKYVLYRFIWDEMNKGDIILIDDVFKVGDGWREHLINAVKDFLNTGVFDKIEFSSDFKKMRKF